MDAIKHPTNYKGVMYTQDVTYPENQLHQKQIDKSSPIQKTKSLDHNILDH